ncbi:MAG: hypothetical protein WDW38_006187 [Sanguina aurantia]
MTTKYGMFTEHQYLKPNTPTLNDKKFVHPEPADVARESGLNFKATLERTGKNNDATFDKFMALSEGDKFIDPAKRALMDLKAKKAGNTVDAPFKTISPMKKSSGLGGQKGAGLIIPLANPPKRGGPGVPNTTISKGKGIAGEWEYILGAGTKDSAAKKSEAGAEKNTVPFKPASLTSKTIGRVIEYIHDPEGPKLVAESARKLAESKRIGQTGAWKPNQNAVKTDMVRSIIRMNI